MITTYYNNGTEAGTYWTDDSNAWDGSESTYASRYLSQYTSKETTKWIKFTNLDTTTSENYDILKVEIGFVHSSSGLYGGLTNYMVPIFNGTSDGDEHEKEAPTSDQAKETVWFDITNDTNAPSTWTPSDLNNLNVKIYAGNNSYWGQSSGIYKVYIRYILERTLKYRKDSTTYEIELSISEDTIYKPIGMQVDDYGVYYAQTGEPSSGCASDLMIQMDGTAQAIFHTQVIDATSIEYINPSDASGGGSTTNSRLCVWKLTIINDCIMSYIIAVTTITGDYKFLLYSSTGVLLENLGEYPMVDGNNKINVPDVKLTGSTTYYFGILTKGSYIFDNGHTGIGGYINMSYITPTNFNPGSLNDTDELWKFDIYVKEKVSYTDCS